MDSWRSGLLIALLWALLYLPGLPGPEFKGEEPRRAIPAREMLETGDWLQPRIAGERYEAKPPLFNWLIATSWAVGGRQNEALARLPSALAMLALALALSAVLRRMVDAQVGLFSALLVLLNPAGLDKGWLAEIDPFYSACFGISLLLWLWGARRRGAGRWGLLLGAGLALAAGLMAKGPLPILWFLLPFWLLVPVGRATGGENGRVAWWKGGQWLVLLVGLGLGLPWFLWAAEQGQAAGAAAAMASADSANSATSAAEGPWQTWKHELLVRLQPGEGGFQLLDSPKVLAEGLIAFLPWTLLLVPLYFPAWRRRLGLGAQREFFVKRWCLALAMAFVPIALLPGANGRYLMPLIAPMAAIVAIAYGAPSVAERLPRLRQGWVVALRVLVVLGWIGWAAALVSVFALRAEGLGPELGWLGLGLVALILGSKLVARLPTARRWTTLMTATAFLAAGFVGTYCFARPHWFAGDDTLRSMASRIQSGREAGQPLYLYRFRFKGEEGWLFYLDKPRRHLPERDAVPQRAPEDPFLLVTSADRWQSDRDFLFRRLGEPRSVTEFRARPESKRAWVRVEFGPALPAEPWAAQAKAAQVSGWWTAEEGVAEDSENEKDVAAAAETAETP